MKSEDTARRRAQADAVLRLWQAQPYGAGNGQQGQQDAEAQPCRLQRGNCRHGIVVEEQNGFCLGRRVLVSGLEGVRVDDDDPVHHVRVGEQRDSSPIQDEHQGQDNLHYATQLLQIMNGIIRFGRQR